jgi:5-formyltetrahydrofolate cyclo-ligase
MVMNDSPAASIVERKRRARAKSIKRRAEAHAGCAEAAGLILAQRGLPVDHRLGRRVASGFLPYKDEISIVPLMAKLVSAGWTTSLPVVVAKGEPLVFRAWTPGETTVPGIWDIPVPPEGCEQVYPDLLLVPMLAFDRRGYRLGYGGGFYDRTLEMLRNMKPVTAIGVAYAAQEMDEVPHAAYDQPLDWIMTERESFQSAGQ